MLKRNEADYKSHWIDCVATATLRSVNVEVIRSTIRDTVSEIEKSDNIANPPTFPLTYSDLTDAASSAVISRLSLYNYGPAAAYIWQRSCEFNYLELHYES